MRAPIQAGNPVLRGPQEALCVLWHPRGEPTDEDLMEALRSKGFRTIECESSVEAVAWVVSTVMAPPASGPGVSPWSRPSIRPVVFLVDRPARLAGMSEVTDAIEKHASGAAVWVHEPAGTPRLRRFSSPEPTRPPTPVPTVRARAPSLRLACSPDSFASGAAEPVVPRNATDLPSGRDRTLDAAKPRDLLTEEERSMLLDGPFPTPFEHPPHRP